MNKTILRTGLTALLVLVMFINSFSLLSHSKKPSGEEPDTSVIAALGELNVDEVQQELKEAGIRDIAKVDPNDGSPAVELSPDKILEMVEAGETTYNRIITNADALICGDSLMEALETYNIIDSDHMLAGISKTLYWLRDQLPTIYSKNPSVLLLGFGINQVDYYDYMLDNFISYYTDILNDVRKSMPSTRVVVLGINEVSAAQTQSRFFMLADYNKRMAKMCEELGIEFFDPTGLIPDESWYGSDGIHPVKNFYTQIYLPELICELDLV